MAFFLRVPAPPSGRSHKINSNFNIMMEKIWDWVTWSSKNADKVSLTLKGILTGAVTLAAWGFGLGHIEIPSDLSSAIVDGTVNVILALSGLLSAVSIVIGLIRKLALTFAGKNQAIR